MSFAKLWSKTPVLMDFTDNSNDLQTYNDTYSSAYHGLKYPEGGFSSVERNWFFQTPYRGLVTHRFQTPSGNGA